MSALGLLILWPATAVAVASDERICTAKNTIQAEVVALEQAYLLNRFGAYNPAGMLFALRHDVQTLDGSPVQSEAQFEASRARASGSYAEYLRGIAGRIELKRYKRPRPLVLRVNEGDCLLVHFTNLLSPYPSGERRHERVADGSEQYGGAVPRHQVQIERTSTEAPALDTSERERDRELVLPTTPMPSDRPSTRAASFLVNGLEYVPLSSQDCPADVVCAADAANVGLNFGATRGNPVNRSVANGGRGGLVPPGGRAVYRYLGVREGTYFAHSAGAMTAGEGDGGQIGMGLFGAVNVEPRGSMWFRSQVSHSELREALGHSERTETSDGHPYSALDYENARHASGARRGLPILNMLDKRQIVHSDLNAIIVLANMTEVDGHDAIPLWPTQGRKPQSKPNRCDWYTYGSSCGQPFREFTAILHDEVKAVQAFAELNNDAHPLRAVRDNMGINYGVGGMGPMLAARQRGIGPLKNCPECRAEEFFLSSWAVGDPALILSYDRHGKKPIGAMYPDDPSNVHHSYLGDPVRFRNLHAGPKETHVFHLHAHQWSLDASDPLSNYLDSQTISPGATFSYEIAYGGSGNRNLSPGDSIYHCHLYPHFAQGMWSLWRSHDVFEDGLPGRNSAANPRARNLPDAEIEGGIETPAVVPLPGQALAPMPTAEMRGYPFYIPGEAGHRPPQPPLDFDVTELGEEKRKHGKTPDSEDIHDGGLGRHVLSAEDPNVSNRVWTTISPTPAQAIEFVRKDALAKGNVIAQINAQRVSNLTPTALSLAAMWDRIDAFKALPADGTEEERLAMKYHAGRLDSGGLKPVTQKPDTADHWRQEHRGYLTDWASTISIQKPFAAASQFAAFRVNGRGPKPGAPFADPCPPGVPDRNYRAAFIQTQITLNKHGWFDPQARIIALERDIKDVIDPNTRVKMPEPLFFRANSNDCINFKSSNFVPSALNADDFQLYTPTDTIGQHIHLVKFDVTSSDGSGNGWNYEDSTFSPDEVRERLLARIKALGPARMAEWRLPKTHPLFIAERADMVGGGQGNPLGTACIENQPGTQDCVKRRAAFLAKGECPTDLRQRVRDAFDDPKGVDHAFAALLEELSEHHPYCGAQRTTQRWWADPLYSKANPNYGHNKDMTIRTVFTHDHMGPSSHQQHGLYAALVIEPTNSVWLNVAENTLDWDKLCSGDPTEKNKVIGGAWLANNIAHQCVTRRGSGAQSGSMTSNLPLGRGIAHGPIQLRDDGGPTATIANIISPRCKTVDTNPLDPSARTERPSDRRDFDNCPPSYDTKREYAIAFADFGVAYNLALEPINPETRDESALRKGQRQVPYNLPNPLAISLEDPGSQYINYRHEPLALRMAQVSLDRNAPGGVRGFRYEQQRCDPASAVCLGDSAYAFSTTAHRDRDLRLATRSYAEFVGASDAAGGPEVLVSESLRAHLANTKLADKLSEELVRLEEQRRAFNCALLGPSDRSAPEVQSQCRFVAPDSRWRRTGDPATPVVGTFEGERLQLRLIQGAQEAQHVFAVNGLKWLRQPGTGWPQDRYNRSGWTSAQPLGISEHFEFDVAIPRYDAHRSDYLYYGSSIDQLWDGMWGIVRAHRAQDGCKDQVAETGLARIDCGALAHQRVSARADGPRASAEPDTRLVNRRAAAYIRDHDQKWVEYVTRVSPRTPNVALRASQTQSAGGGLGNADLIAKELRDCVAGPSDALKVHFDVSVVRACDLFANCNDPDRKGIKYNRRLKIHDPFAMVYVQNNLANFGESPEKKWPPYLGQWNRASNGEVLKRLRAEFRTGRRVLEPMVLRAPAGACIRVLLRNHLPPAMRDDGLIDQGKTPAAPAGDSDNFLPMITDGFNYNQLRPSSVVGLSAPLVAQIPSLSDGTNVGLTNELDADGGARGAPNRALGSLVPACHDHENPRDSSQCARIYRWYAGHFERSGDPVWKSTSLRTTAAASGGMARGRQPSRMVVDPDQRRSSQASGRPRQDDRDEEPLIHSRNDQVDATPSDSMQKDMPIEFGAIPLRSFGDPIKHPSHGLVGALVIGPEGAHPCKPHWLSRQERQADAKTQLSQSICTLNRYGKPTFRYRDFVMVLQDSVDARLGSGRLPNLKGAEEPDDYGGKAINYRSEPIWGRRGGTPEATFEDRNEFDYADVLSSKCLRGDQAYASECKPWFDALLKRHGFKSASGRMKAARLLNCQAGVDGLTKMAQPCDPETPVFVAQAGRQVRMRVVHPGGHTRQQGIAIHGHAWDPMPHLPGYSDQNSARTTGARSKAPREDVGSARMYLNSQEAIGKSWLVQGVYNGVGPMMSANLLIQAGGAQCVSGDYLYRSQASFMFDGGIWGLLRVHPSPVRCPFPKYLSALRD